MIHKTSELTGALLDAAVSKACGCKFKVTESALTQKTLVMALGPDGQPWWPSHRWEHGGPIIDREEIQIGGYGNNRQAEIRCDNGPWVDHWGETTLIAAMRAYVAYKLGDNVEL